MNTPSRGAAPDIVAIRSAWQFVYLNAFLSTFADCIDELEVDPAVLEQELLRKRPSPLLARLHKVLLKPLIVARGAEGWEKTTSRLLARDIRSGNAYPFTENPLPSDNPKVYHALPAMTRLDILWLLCDGHLQKNKAVRDKIDQTYRKPAYALNRSDLNILNSQPIGYDKQQRSYWSFGDWPWVYRRARPPTPPQQPCADDQWEVVASTLDELVELIEVFRKEFLSTESELKNALQRLLARAEDIERRKRQVEKSRERAFALLQGNTLCETRTRVRQRVVRYGDDDHDDDDEQLAEVDAIEEDDRHQNTTFASRSNDASDHNMRLRSARPSSFLNDSDHDSVASTTDDESSPSSPLPTDQTSVASQNKRKRRDTQSSAELPDTSLTGTPPIYHPRGSSSSSSSSKYRHTTTVVVQVPPSSASLSTANTAARQQSTLNAWTSAFDKSASSSSSNSNSLS